MVAQEAQHSAYGKVLRAIERQGIRAPQMPQLPDCGYLELKSYPLNDTTVRALVYTENGLRVVDRQREGLSSSNGTIVEHCIQSAPRTLTVEDIEKLRVSSVNEFELLMADNRGSRIIELREKLGDGGGRVDIPVALGPNSVSFTEDRETVKVEIAMMLSPRSSASEYKRVLYALSLLERHVVDRILQRLATEGQLPEDKITKLRHNMVMGIAEVIPNIVIHNLLGLSNEERGSEDKLSAAINRLDPSGARAAVHLSFRLEDDRIVLRAEQPNPFKKFDDWLSHSEDCKTDEKLEVPSGRGALILKAIFDRYHAENEGRVMEFSRPLADLHQFVMS